MVFLAFLFLLGLTVGSFLNVLIDRLPKEEKFFWGRSHCDSCRHKLSWYDLIPVVSWLFLNRRCRYCRHFISFQYPLVELTTGVFFVLIPAWVTSWCRNVPNCYIDILLYCYIACSLIVVFFTDLKYQIIPDKVVFPAILIALLYFLFSIPHLAFVHFLASFGAGGFFLILLILTKGKGMGLGDVKLAFLIGLFLGWPKIAVSLYLAFLTGAALGVILILRGKKKFGEPIPFGPFLIGGTWVALFWGEKIIELAAKMLL